MRQQRLISVCPYLLIACFLSGCGAPAGNTAEADAVAAILKLGGKVEYSEINPDRPVLKVYLHSTKVQDADLAALEKLPRLQNLFLGRTKISDAGLGHLQKASHLETLSLNSTAVTDDGIKRLSHLKNLKTLNLQETKVTEAGVKELKQALPGLTIAR
ncbi:MAG: hypothetical protein JWM11_7539 [Planctomycetaceae bacterium]|nr:hypothetical protein [Planctomycetaceae bacterium]